MFKIGEFSKLSQVSVKTLRYYDEIGLFKPARVDRFTAYRAYSAEQLPRLNRILALRDLGFSLEQIGQMVDDDLSAEQIRGMLRLKRAEIERQLGEEQARLARVEARLRQIEREGQMAAYEVVLKQTPPLRVAAIRTVVPTYADVASLIGELFAYLGQQGVKPAGPPLGIYHDQEFRERDADVEAAVPVEQPLDGTERINVRQLPGADETATAVHRGPFDGIGEAYVAIMMWTEANGYRISGPGREVYLQVQPGTDPAAYVTEVQFPVEKG